MRRSGGGRGAGRRAGSRQRCQGRRPLGAVPVFSLPAPSVSVPLSPPAAPCWGACLTNNITCTTIRRQERGREEQASAKTHTCPTAADQPTLLSTHRTLPPPRVTTTQPRQEAQHEGPLRRRRLRPGGGSTAGVRQGGGQPLPFRPPPPPPASAAHQACAGLESLRAMRQRVSAREGRSLPSCPARG